MVQCVPGAQLAEAELAPVVVSSLSRLGLFPLASVMTSDLFSSVCELILALFLWRGFCFAILIGVSLDYLGDPMCFSVHSSRLLEAQGQIHPGAQDRVQLTKCLDCVCDCKAAFFLDSEIWGRPKIQLSCLL